MMSFFHLFKIDFSATKIDFKKPPAGGGARGWIRNSTKLECLHSHFRPINQGKDGEHSAMVSIMQEIHVLFIKRHIFQTEANRHITAYRN